MKQPKCFAKAPKKNLLFKQTVMAGASVLTLGAVVMADAQAAACPANTNSVGPGASCTAPLSWTLGSGTLTNSGTISGASQGLVINSSGRVLDMLDNRGTISATGSAIQVVSSGSIGTILNSGYLHSPTGVAIAVFSGGTMSGPLVNTGTIFGGVINRSASQLEIIGVTDGSGNFGTFTSSGRTIEGTLGGVRFSAGNSLVDMNMNVGLGQTVTNSGAALKFINNRSINGNFSQSSGSLIFAALSATSFPKLTVSGTASLTGGNIVLLPISGAASAGTYTIISAAGGLSSSASALASGYTVASTVSGNNLLLTLAPDTGSGTGGGSGTGTGTTTPPVAVDPGTGTTDPVIPPAGNTDTSVPAPVIPTAQPEPAKPTWTARANVAGGQAVPVGPVLDALSSNSNYTVLLGVLSSLPATEQNAALKQLGTPVTPTQAVAAGATFALSAGAIGQRQTALLAGQPVGKAAGSNADGAGVWAQLLGNRATLDSSVARDGFRSRGYGITLGADSYVHRDLLAGGAFSWLHSDLDGSGGSSGNNARVDSYQLATYASWRPQGERLFFHGLLSAGRNDYSQVRSLDFLNGAARADYHGWQGQIKLGAGYDIPLHSGLTFTPLANLTAARVENDSYQERDAGVANMNVARQGFNTVESELAMKLTSSSNTDYGRFIGDIQTGWLHSFTNQAIATTATLGGISFVTDTDRLAKDGARLVLRGTLKRTDNLSFSLEYDGTLRKDFRSQTAMAKMRYDF